jgi:hypothetical protein
VFCPGTLLTDEMEENILKFVTLKTLTDFVFKKGPKLLVEIPLLLSVGTNR